MVAIDPGLTFGISHAVSGECFHVERPALRGLEWLQSAIAAGVVDRVVIERFDPRRWDEEAVLTVEFIGVIRWLCKQGGIPIGEVNADAKKKTLPETEHIEGGHARDAEAVRLWDLRYGKW